MEEVKYILGDLVSPDGSIAKIISIAPGLGKGNIEIGFSNGWHFTAYYKDFTDAILGILLTPEILEKNGWKRTQIFIDDDGFEFHTYIDDERCLDLQYYPQYKKFAAFICKQEVLSDIEYVHQLQHLLFGLGLPMDLKV